MTDQHRVKTPDGVFESQALNLLENTKSEPDHSAPNLRFWAPLSAFPCHPQQVFDVQKCRIWGRAAHGRALPAVGTAQSKSPGSVFVFSVCFCILCAEGWWFLGKQSCLPSLSVQLFSVSAAFRNLPSPGCTEGSERFELIPTTAGAKADFGVPLKGSWELSSSLPLNSSLKMLDEILN